MQKGLRIVINIGISIIGIILSIIAHGGLWNVHLCNANGCIMCISNSNSKTHTSMNSGVIIKLKVV